MRISERQIEDFCEAFIDQVVGQPVSDTACIARQFTLASGKRLDLLALTMPPDQPGRAILTVVEVKADEAGIEAVVQLVEYMEEIERTLTPEQGQSIEVRGVVAAPGFRGASPEALVGWMPRVSLCRLQVTFGIYGPDPTHWEPTPTHGRVGLEVGRPALIEAITRGAESIEEVRGMLNDLSAEVQRQIAAESEGPS